MIHNFNIQIKRGTMDWDSTKKSLQRILETFSENNITVEIENDQLYDGDFTRDDFLK